MESQIDVVLKFSEDKTVWICPECDLENDMTNGACDVCGFVRQPNAEIVSLYEAPTPVAPVEIDNGAATPYTGTLSDRTPPAGTPGSYGYYGGGGPGYPPRDEKKNTNAWAWVALVVFIIIIAIIANSGEF